jgi:hypothetical protein
MRRITHGETDLKRLGYDDLMNRERFIRDSGRRKTRLLFDLQPRVGRPERDVEKVWSI